MSSDVGDLPKATASHKPAPKEMASTVFYNRGVLVAALHVEAIRNALKAKPDGKITGADVKVYMPDDATLVDIALTDEYSVGATASDADVSIGSGPVVHGPLVSLLLVASGRRAALDDLHGPGVVELATRLGVES